MFQSRQSRRLAFSLVEIMVAVTLLSLIIVGLLAMFFQTQRAFRAGLAQSDVMEAGRAAMEMMTRELSEMSASQVANVVNMHVGTVLGEVQTMPGSNPPRQNEIADVRFLSRENDQWYGTLYRVDHLAADGSSIGAGTLYRYRARTNTYDAGIQRTTLAAVLPPLSGALGAVQSADLSADPPDSYAAKYGLRRLIDGVVHFRVHALDADGVLIVTNGTDVVVSGPPLQQTFGNARIPAYVEVELGILEPKAFESLQARPEGVRSTFISQMASKVHLFRQRVWIRTE